MRLVFAVVWILAKYHDFYFVKWRFVKGVKNIAAFGDRFCYRRLFHLSKIVESDHIILFKFFI